MHDEAHEREPVGDIGLSESGEGNELSDEVAEAAIARARRHFPGQARGNEDPARGQRRRQPERGQASARESGLSPEDSLLLVRVLRASLSQAKPVSSYADRFRRSRERGRQHDGAAQSALHRWLGRGHRHGAKRGGRRCRRRRRPRRHRETSRAPRTGARAGENYQAVSRFACYAIQ